jgi:hypothetical protein
MVVVHFILTQHFLLAADRIVPSVIDAAAH